MTYEYLIKQLDDKLHQGFLTEQESMTWNSILADLKALKILKDNADYHYDEWYGMRGNQCIMIGITEKDECFEFVKKRLDITE